MAGQTSVNVSDLVLLTRAVITQEHNLRKCQLCGIKLINSEIDEGNVQS